MNTAQQLIESASAEFALTSRELSDLIKQCESFLKGRGRLPPKRIIDRFLVIGAVAVFEYQQQQEHKAAISGPLGYPVIPLIAWCRNQGWSFDQVKTMFQAFETEVRDVKIRAVLADTDDSFDVADVSPRHKRQLEIAIEE